MPDFAAMAPGYRALWSRCRVTRASAADRVAVRILSPAAWARYKEVERRTGVPAEWIGAIHDRESGGDFRGVLHNGEHIIGTGRRTRLVPAGCGPFATWEDAAVDALRIKGLHLITSWTIDRKLFEAERFNGFGYVARGVNSPYLWGGTSLQQPGKYIRDGVWSRTAWDTQLGVAAVLARLAAADKGIAVRLGERAPIAAAREAPEVPKRIGPSEKGKITAAGTGTLTTVGTAAASGPPAWVIVLAVIAGVAVVAGVVWWILRARPKLAAAGHDQKGFAGAPVNDNAPPPPTDDTETKEAA